MKTRDINDMYFVAALLSYGAELKEVDKSDKRRQIFKFVDSPIKVWKMLDNNSVTKIEFIDLEQVEMLFRSKKLMFLPDYHNFVRDTKSMIHTKES